MTLNGRRRFLQTVYLPAGAAALTVFPESIRRRCFIPASRRTGSIDDVEHIVVFMQENRSFDHYMGHMQGVRGYNDRFPVHFAERPAGYGSAVEEDSTKPVLPFHLNTAATTNAQCVGDLDHSWYPTHYAINNSHKPVARV